MTAVPATHTTPEASTTDNKTFLSKTSERRLHHGKHDDHEQELRAENARAALGTVRAGARRRSPRKTPREHQAVPSRPRPLSGGRFPGTRPLSGRRRRVEGHRQQPRRCDGRCRPAHPSQPRQQPARGAEQERGQRQAGAHRKRRPRAGMVAGWHAHGGRAGGAPGRADQTGTAGSARAGDAPLRGPHPRKP